MQTRNTLNCLRKKERETRKNIIIDAARTLFAHKGYNMVSMAEIAHAAGIGKSTIYTYFDSQETLYIEIACRDTQLFIAELKDTLEQNAPNLLGSAISFFIESYCQHKQRFHMILDLALSGGINREFCHGFHGNSRKLLEILDGIFEVDNYTEDVRFMSHTLLSLLNGVFMTFQNYPPNRYDDAEKKMMKIGKKIEIMFKSLKKN